jgi:hypothetical protein
MTLLQNNLSKANLVPACCPPEVTKVVFLDFDGVFRFLGPQAWRDQVKEGTMERLYKEFMERYNVDYSVYDYYDVAIIHFEFDKQSTDLLHDILTKTGAKIVLSTDWRLYRSMETMYNLLMLRDLHKFYIDNTIDLNRENEQYYRTQLNISEEIYDSRTIEILEYLHRFSHITHYIAIDDIHLQGSVRDHLIHTTHRITPEHAAQALKILGYED